MKLLIQGSVKASDWSKAICCEECRASYEVDHTDVVMFVAIGLGGDSASRKACACPECGKLEELKGTDVPKASADNSYLLGTAELIKFQQQLRDRRRAYNARLAETKVDAR